jgi:hypothetical protein
MTGLLSYIENQCQIHILSQSNRSVMTCLMIVKSNLRMAISIGATSYNTL